MRQCLDGFVMQQTTFPFEAIVHDDASTDGSDAIIREYAEKYPDIIKPIYESENQYGKGIISKKIDDTMHPDSKYIALCEGDDYWTDPNKLQIQVDFLESHPDYSFSVHEYQEWDELKADYRPHQLRFLKNTENDLSITLDDYATGVFFTKTLTCVYNRKALLDSNFYMYDTKFDMTMFYALMTQGKCRLFNRVMGCYRIQPNSITSSMNIRRFRRSTNDAMFSLCRVEKTEQSREFVFNYLKPFALSVILNHQWKTIKYYYKYLGMRRAFVISIVEPVRIIWQILMKRISDSI